jgi:hypothetical protein
VHTRSDARAGVVGETWIRQMIGRKSEGRFRRRLDEIEPLVDAWRVGTTAFPRSDAGTHPYFVGIDSRQGHVDQPSASPCPKRMWLPLGSVNANSRMP